METASPTSQTFSVCFLKFLGIDKEIRVQIIPWRQAFKVIFFICPQLPENIWNFERTLLLLLHYVVVTTDIIVPVIYTEHKLTWWFGYFARSIKSANKAFNWISFGFTLNWTCFAMLMTNDLNFQFWDLLNRHSYW